MLESLWLPLYEISSLPTSYHPGRCSDGLILVLQRLIANRPSTKADGTADETLAKAKSETFVEG